VVVNGSSVNSIRKDTVPEGSIAVQCMDLVINASEQTFPTEPRPPFLQPMENPAAEERVEARQRGRGSSDAYPTTARKEVVRPL
jgi:hypothetical protein